MDSSPRQLLKAHLGFSRHCVERYRGRNGNNNERYSDARGELRAELLQATFSSDRPGWMWDNPRRREKAIGYLYTDDFCLPVVYDERRKRLLAVTYIVRGDGDHVAALDWASRKQWISR